MVSKEEEEEVVVVLVPTEINEYGY